MADEFDVEAMLEAPFKQEDLTVKTGNGVKEEEKPTKKRDKKRSRSRSGSRGKSRKRSRSRSRGKKARSPHRSRRSRSRSRSKGKKKSRSKSPERNRSRYDKDRRGYRGSRHDRDRDHGKDKYGGYSSNNDKTADGKKSPSPTKKKETADSENRDARTVFVMQLSQRVRERDLKEFFVAVGKVRDCKIITDRNSRRSKGVGYVEFDDEASVPYALALNSQRLMGAPIIVQPSHSEKNRQAAQQQTLQKGNTGPMRIYVGSLHFNINEDMLRGIFEPFGKIENIQLIRDTETGRSKGYGFITFSEADEAKRALDQLNGFELAGRLIKVGHVTERTDNPQDVSLLDSDELERTGIGMTQTGRLQLMAKLAEGTNFEIPRATAEALHPLAQVPGIATPLDQIAAAGDPSTLQASLALAQQQAQQAAIVSQQQATGGATQSTTPCFMLSNMFDPTRENSPTWDEEIRDDVITECTQHGGVLHIHVDKASPEGRVYIKCPTVEIALAAVNTLHGRWFAGKMITAAFVPLSNYHDIFPTSVNATQLLQPRT
ncbi:RNA-binding protein 39-like isoform X2 [Apostichopus japonicus]|uniref:RNA-binding protein 39-like isoform X2 n=1 Tax=Stichopus japonicus TaxID=307972 RepID=UPI003AB2ABBC